MSEEMIQPLEIYKETSALEAIKSALGSEKTPQQAALDSKLSNDFGVPVTAVNTITPEEKINHKVQGYEKVMAQVYHPVLNRRLREDPNFAILVRDDITNVGMLESAIWKLAPKLGQTPEGLVDSSWNSAIRGAYQLGNTAPIAGAVGKIRDAQETISRIDAIKKMIADGKTNLEIFGSAEDDPDGSIRRMNFDANADKDRAQAELKRQRYARTAAFISQMSALFPQSADMAQFNEAKTFGDAMKAFASNPLSVLANTGPESFAQFAPMLAASALISPLGLPAQMLATGSYSYALDRNAAVSEGLANAGVNMMDEKAILGFLSNPENDAKVKQIFTESDSHAGPVALFDAMSLGAARYRLRFGEKVPMLSIATQEIEKAKLSTRLGDLVFQTQVQGLMGGTGEALGQIRAKGKVTSWSDVIAEYAGEHFSAPVEMMTASMSAMRDAQEARLAAMREREEIDNAASDMRAFGQGDAVVSAAYAEHIRKIAQESGITGIVIDVASLNNENPQVIEAIRNVLPEKAGEIAEALATGSSITIPLDEYAMSIARDEALVKATLNHSHTDKNESVAEAEALIQALNESSQTQLAEKLEGATEDFKAGVKQVGKEIASMLEAVPEKDTTDGSGRKIKGMSKSEKAHIQALIQTLVANAAEDAGISPALLWAQRGIQGVLTDADIEIVDGQIVAKSDKAMALLASPSDSQSQKEDGKTKGMFFSVNRIIARFGLNGADQSTFLHETGHWFLGMRAELARQLKAMPTRTASQQRLVDTIEETVKWLGANSVEDFLSADDAKRTTMEEKFARTFEGYLGEGRAPSSALVTVFNKFSSWLRSIYAFFTADPNFKLSDDVRKMYDGLFTAATEIKEAQLRRGIFGAYEKAAKAISGDDAVNAIAQAMAVYFEEAEAEAMQKFRERGTKDITYLRNLREQTFRAAQKEARRLRAEIMAQELAKRSDAKDIEAFTKLRKGIVRTVDGKEVTIKPRISVEELKAAGISDALIRGLSTLGFVAVRTTDRVVSGELLAKDLEYSSLSSMLSSMEKFVKQVALSKLGVKRHKLLKSELESAGVSEETIAKLKARGFLTESEKSRDKVSAAKFASNYGYESVGAMAESMATLLSPEEEATAAVDARMVEEHPEYATENSIKEQADAAIFNRASARLVAAQIDLLSGMEGGKRVNAELFAAIALKMIGNIKVSDLKPRTYRANAAKLARLAQSALANRKGRPLNAQAAVAYKRQQLLQMSLAEEAQNFRDGISSAVAKVRKRFGRGSTASKVIDVEYQKQIYAVLTRFGVLSKALDNTPPYAEFFASNLNSDGTVKNPMMPPMPESLIATKATDIKEMTVTEATDLFKFVNQLIRAGESTMEIRVGNKVVSILEAQGEILKGIRENVANREIKEKAVGENVDDSLKHRIMKSTKAFFSAHARNASLLSQLEGTRTGAFFKFITKRADACRDRETKLLAEKTKELMKYFEVLFPAVDDHKQIKYDELNASLSKREIVAIALNCANKENINRLIEGSNLYSNTDYSPDGEKHRWTEAGIKAVIAKTLTKEQLLAIQGIWNTMGSLWEDARRVEINTMNREPKKVNPDRIEFKLPNNETVSLEGGYYPIRYDRLINGKLRGTDYAETGLTILNGGRPATRQGQMRERTGSSGQAVSLTFQAGFDGLNAVIHDICWREAVIDFNKIFDNKSAVTKEIRKYFGNEPVDSIHQWIDDIALEGRKPTNAGTIVANALSKHVGIAGLGFNVMTAAVQPFGYIQTVAVIGKKYAALGVGRLLTNPVAAKNFAFSHSDMMKMRAETQFREIVEVQRAVSDGKFGRGMDRFRKMAYVPITMTQLWVDIATWNGAYQKAFDELGMEIMTDEEREEAEKEAIAIANRAVIDAQGSGSLSDMSAMERGDAWQKLFTVFYNYFNTAFNIMLTSFKTEGKLESITTILMIALLQPTIEAVARGFAGELAGGDDDWRKKEKLLKKIGYGVADFNLGLFMGFRELTGIAEYAMGERSYGYSGPGGLRKINSLWTLAKQVGQGEIDEQFIKSATNVASEWLGLPAAELNRIIHAEAMRRHGKDVNAFSYVLTMPNDKEDR